MSDCYVLWFRYRVVQSMRGGMSPEDAAKEALSQISSYYPQYSGALIAVHVNGSYGKWILAVY